MRCPFDNTLSRFCLAPTRPSMQRQGTVVHYSLDPAVEPVSRYHLARTRDGSGCIPFSPIQGREHVCDVEGPFLREYKVKISFGDPVALFTVQYLWPLSTSSVRMGSTCGGVTLTYLPEELLVVCP